jgi:hypothetical protein
MAGKNEDWAKMFHVKHFRRPFVEKSCTLDASPSRTPPRQQMRAGAGALSTHTDASALATRNVSDDSCVKSRLQNPVFGEPRLAFEYICLS